MFVQVKQILSNKVRIVGFLILIAGIIILKTLDNDFYNFLSGALIGVGGAFLLTGKIRKT
ncbi:hypothetical protein HX109_12395 [Galbibacter sp. BG1]|nr:hypothetical protein HX109_12395 [Galbibacter sp. BG1]